MKKLTKLYNPSEMKEILDIMQENFDSSLDPFKRMSTIVIALHKRNYKIIKLNEDNCIDKLLTDV